MKKSHLQFLLVGTALLIGNAGQAQPMMGRPMGPKFGGPMTKLFGDVTGFSAKAEMQMTTAAEKEPITMSIEFALLDSKVRTTMDMASMKSSKMNPAAAAQMKQMGVDKMVSISRPDKKVVWLVYPGLQGYVETPMPQDEAESAERSDCKIDKTELGKETVETHPCVKNKVIVTCPNAKAQEFVVWNATDMKDFPAKLEMKQNESTVVMVYRDIKLAKPDAAQFEPPAGFKKYASMQEMMMANMQRFAPQR